MSWLLRGAVVGLAVFVVGCGQESGDRQDALTSRFDRPVPEAQRFSTRVLEPSEREIPLLVQGGYCVREKRETQRFIDRVEVEETDKTVTITVFTTQRGYGSGEVCLGVGDDMLGEASLAEPLGDRVLLDGASSPAKLARQKRAIPELSEYSAEN